jgi:site-specific recombinase XerD
MTKKLEGCSSETLDGYRVTLQAFFAYVHKDVKTITANEIRDYLSDYQTRKKIVNRSIDSIRRTLSSFFNYLEDEDIITKSPMRKIHHIKYDKTIQKPFTEEDIEKLRDYCMKNHRIRDLAIIEFLNSSGVRVSELVNIDIDDLDLHDRECVVFGKGSKERVVYFDANSAIHIQQYLKSRDDDNPALFVSEREPVCRLNLSGIETICRTIGKICEIDDCHPHRFRRTLATRLIERGVPIEHVQKILGHSKIDTTLIYAQVSQESVKLSHAKYCS